MDDSPTTYEPLTIDQLCDASYQTAEEKGFHRPDPNFYERMMLIVTECGEAVEDVRAGKDPSRLEYTETGKPIGVPSEVADIFIRLGDLCKEFGVPITEAIREKLSYNRTRPHMHGKLA